MIIHFISRDNVENLKSVFATLTPVGWVIPEWILLLERTVQ